MKSIVLLTSLVFSISLVGNLRADSLYNPVPNANGGRGPINYYSDPKARQVGDILTVVVTETATANSTATTTGAKTESGNFGPGFGPFLHLIKSVGLSGNESSNATGTTSRADTLGATIAVTVKQVRPNGDLVVQGSRSVGMNAETQTITLTGIVRPLDISPTNTVQSPQVADAQIKYSGKGPVGELQHDGLVRKIFRFLY